MHQSFDPESSVGGDSATAALQQRLRLALARDLNLPEQHEAISATLQAFAIVAEQRPASRGVPAVKTLDAWWLIVAHAHALVAK